jgi:hypothetical protein
MMFACKQGQDNFGEMLILLLERVFEKQQSVPKTLLTKTNVPTT